MLHKSILPILIIAVFSCCKGTNDHESSTNNLEYCDLTFDESAPRLRFSINDSKENVLGLLDSVLIFGRCDSNYIANYCFGQDSIKVIVSDRRNRCFELRSEDILSCYINNTNHVLVENEIIKIDSIANMIQTYICEHYKSYDLIYVDWSHDVPKERIYAVLNSIREGFKKASLNIALNELQLEPNELKDSDCAKLEEIIEFKVSIKQTMLTSEPTLPATQ